MSKVIICDPGRSDSHGLPRTRPGITRRRLIVLLALLFGVGAVVLKPVNPALPPGVSRDDFREAAAEFRAVFGRKGDSADVLMTLARNAAREKDSATAIACYRQIPTDHRRYGSSARYEEAVLYAQTDQVQRAEDGFTEFLELQKQGLRLPQRQVTHSRRWLSLIFGVELRSEDRQRVLQGLMDDREADINDLRQYYFQSSLIWQTVFGTSRIQDFLKLDPENRHLRAAEARFLIGAGRLGEARQRLEVLRREDPRDLRVLSFLLECSYELNDWAAFAADMAQAPDFNDSEPWLLTEMRGEWGLQQQDWPAAQRYFQHRLAADPANTGCLMGLARAFEGQGRAEERVAILERARWAARLKSDLAAVNSDNPQAARAVASSARQLGMEDAAAIFEFFADRMPGGLP